MLFTMSAIFKKVTVACPISILQPVFLVSIQEARDHSEWDLGTMCEKVRYNLLRKEASFFHVLLSGLPPEDVTHI